ncbi:hypothetical protein X759_02795 [Mesorhizobium sp. LSHC420B00]|nr:hypothetical protein X759_02795 [Mesorhizobium sp. LSHC420B00]
MLSAKAPVRRHSTDFVLAEGAPSVNLDRRGQAGHEAAGQWICRQTDLHGAVLPIRRKDQGHALVRSIFCRSGSVTPDALAIFIVGNNRLAYGFRHPDIVAHFFDRGCIHVVRRSRRLLGSV